MANPFGLPRAILAERESRRRRRFQLGVYTALSVATVLLAGMLIQGCRSQRSSLAASAAEEPVKLANNTVVDTSTNLLLDPAPEPAAETNYVSPGSDSLPDNVTLPGPAIAPATQAITARPLVPGRTLRKSLPPRNPPGVYVVKPGDTLTRIARAHGWTVQDLKTANHLKSDRIFAGEKLKLPRTDLAMARAAQN